MYLHSLIVSVKKLISKENSFDAKKYFFVFTARELSDAKIKVITLITILRLTFDQIIDKIGKHFQCLTTGWGGARWVFTKNLKKSRFFEFCGCLQANQGYKSKENMIFYLPLQGFSDILCFSQENRKKSHVLRPFGVQHRL